MVSTSCERGHHVCLDAGVMVTYTEAVVNAVADLGDAGAGEELGLELVFHVDAEGRLTFVNDRWDAFAIANHAPHLIGAAVIGRRVTDFIHGSETQMIYDLLIKRALSGASVTLPFRCDGPAERRRMALTILPLPPGRVEFRSRTVDLDSRPSVRVLEPHPERDHASLLTICSWCNRGRAHDRWAEIEDVVSTLGLFDQAVPELTHGMCPDCVRLVTADWEA